MAIMNAIASRSRASCLAISLGRMEYLRAWETQRRLHGQVADGVLPNLLLLVEHPHVYTLGRRGKASDILVDDRKLADLGVEVHFIDRGGEVTYHGPGQLVGYPIVNLRNLAGGPLRYVRMLEETLLETLADFGIRAESADRPTGVWTGDAKIAAIGVKVGRGVTMHGFALNVDPDLSFFDHIVPCGMPSGSVTSISSLVSGAVDVQQVVPVVARHFGRVFRCKIQWPTLQKLDQIIQAEASIAVGSVGP